LSTAPSIPAARPRRSLPVPAVLRGLGVLSLALLFLSAWLFLPSGGPDPAELGPSVRVCLVDASASARRCRAGWLRWARATLRDESLAAAAAGQELAVISFGARARLRFGPAEAATFTDALLGHDGPPFDPAGEIADDGASALAQALRVASSLVLAPDRRPGEVVLLGEGAFTGEDPRALLGELWRGGATTRTIPIEAPRTHPDIALLDLAMPAVLEAGAPLRAVATLAWTPGTSGDEQASLLAELACGGTFRPFVFPLELPAGGKPPEAARHGAVGISAARHGRTQANRDKVSRFLRHPFYWKPGSACSNPPPPWR